MVTRYELFFDDNELDREIFGNDDWQTDYESVTEIWRVTCNVSINDNKVHSIRFSAH